MFTFSSAGVHILNWKVCTCFTEVCICLTEVCTCFSGGVCMLYWKCANVVLKCTHALLEVCTCSTSECTCSADGMHMCMHIRTMRTMLGVFLMLILNFLGCYICEFSHTRLTRFSFFIEYCQTLIAKKKYK